MKGRCHLIYRRCPQTHTNHTKGYVLSVVTHAAYLFVSSNVLSNTLFISPDFSCGKRVRVHVSCVCFCVSCWGTSLGVYWSLRAKVHSIIWSSLTTLSAASLPQPVMFWIRLTCCPQSKVILLTKPPAGNDSHIIFGLTWAIRFIYFALFDIWF